MNENESFRRRAFNLTLNFNNVSLLGTQVLLKRLAALVENEELLEVKVEHLRKSEFSALGEILLSFAPMVVNDVLLALSILQEKHLLSNLRSEIDERRETISKRPSEEVAREFQLMVAEVVKYSKDGKVYIKITGPNDYSFVFDSRVTAGITYEELEQNDAPPLSGKQLSYLEGLTKDNLSRERAREYLLSHNVRALNYLSKREASELIKILKGDL